MNKKLLENQYDVLYGKIPETYNEAVIILDKNNEISDYTLYSSCEPCFMCSGAMVWAKLGRLVYAASNVDLGNILQEDGCTCSEMVFAHSPWRPKVTPGVLRNESLEILRKYFSNH